MSQDRRASLEGAIFMTGRSQAVRLPKAFRLPGKRVRVSREGNGILLMPIIEDIDVWFDALDRLGGADFFEGGRNQPPMPPTEDLFG